MTDDITPLPLLALPLNVLGLILELDCFSGLPLFRVNKLGCSRISFAERARMFYKDTPIERIVRQGIIFGDEQALKEEWEMWISRPRFTLTYNKDRVLELALTCTRFWRALKKVHPVKAELFRDDYYIATIGSFLFGSDRHQKFPARFCSHSSECLEEVVDTLQGCAFV